jgi:hypothetical protein
MHMMFILIISKNIHVYKNLCAPLFDYLLY